MGAWALTGLRIFLYCKAIHLVVDGGYLAATVEQDRGIEIPIADRPINRTHDVRSMFAGQSPDRRDAGAIQRLLGPAALTSECLRQGDDVRAARSLLVDQGGDLLQGEARFEADAHSPHRPSNVSRSRLAVGHPFAFEHGAFGAFKTNQRARCGSGTRDELSSVHVTLPFSESIGLSRPSVHLRPADYFKLPG